MGWFERTFPNDTPIELWPHVMDRLRGVPVRIEEKVRGVSREKLTRRRGEDWSIQEHIGHLLDFETPDGLHSRRLDDYERGAEVLTAADVTNARTWAANHNAADIDELLARFRDARTRLLARLDAMSAAGMRDRVGLHPRLTMPMRLIDMLVFWAEHDDHHLAKIHELIHAD